MDLVNTFIALTHRLVTLSDKQEKQNWTESSSKREREREGEREDWIFLSERSNNWGQSWFRLMTKSNIWHSFLLSPSFLSLFQWFFSLFLWYFFPLFLPSFPNTANWNSVNIMKGIPGRVDYFQTSYLMQPKEKRLISLTFRVLLFFSRETTQHDKHWKYCRTNPKREDSHPQHSHSLFIFLFLSLLLVSASPLLWMYSVRCSYIQYNTG